MILLLLVLGLLVIFITVLSILYIKLIRQEKRIYNAFRAQGLVGEPFVPLIGQLPEMRKKRNNDQLMVYYEELVDKYGFVFLFGLGPLTRLFVHEPDLLAEILSRKNSELYAKPQDFNAAFIPLIGSHNLLVAEGTEHDRARRMIKPAFYHMNLKSSITIITNNTSRIIQIILERQKVSHSVDLQVLFNELSLSIVVSSAFGADFETNTRIKNIICRLITELLAITEFRVFHMITLIPFLGHLPFWGKKTLDKGNRILAEFINQIITDRRQGRSTSMSNGPDLLDLLLSAVDDEGQPFGDLEIKEQSLTFVLAGSETTGNLMTWILYILMTHEDVLQACREEVDRVLPNGMEPTNEHLSDLLVCEAVINETLRLYPPVPFFVRKCIREHTIVTKHPIRIPKGGSILVNTYVLHRRSDLWPRPHEFDYTRWLRDPKTGLKPKLSHPFAYLPFAAGPRNCIGQNFALLEAKIMLAMFVQRCHFDMIPGQKIIPDVKITMRPKYGLWAKITRRRQI